MSIGLLSNNFIYKICSYLDNHDLNNFLLSNKALNNTRNHLQIMEIFINNVFPGRIDYCVNVEGFSKDSNLLNQCLVPVKELGLARLDIKKNRTRYAHQIIYRKSGHQDAIMEKKLRWIQEWIAEEATCEEILKFLTKVTGIPFLKEDHLIVLVETSRIEVHSCSAYCDSKKEAILGLRADFDKNKEGFINFFKFIFIDFNEIHKDDD